MYVRLHSELVSCLGWCVRFCVYESCQCVCVFAFLCMWELSLCGCVCVPVREINCCFVPVCVSLSCVRVVFLYVCLYVCVRERESLSFGVRVCSHGSEKLFIFTARWYYSASKNPCSHTSLLSDGLSPFHCVICLVFDDRMNRSINLLSKLSR